ncbi:MAG: energy transducer TonB [Novosphingobium sp.]
MFQADLISPRRDRVGAFVAVAVLHLALFLALLRAFAPDLTHEAARQVLATFTITPPPAPPPAPPPPPPPPPAKPEREGGAAAPAGRRAVPRAVVAPPPRIMVQPRISAAPIAAAGNTNVLGASDAGAGSGGGGQGSGDGSGKGAGTGAPSAKLSGDISSARDYPAATRALRIDDYVVIYLAVGTDGRAHACRIARPSKDAAADQITCTLAMKRFRFRPATDAAGNPVPSTFGWQQKWFYR